MTKDLAYYMALTYPIELTPEDGVFVAAHPDLPGCLAQGETASEAVSNLNDARESWIAVGLEDHQFIPEPLPTEFSGRLSIRLPISLHASLAKNAQRQGVSLNAFIIARLAESSGAAAPDIQEITSAVRSTVLAVLEPAITELKTIQRLPIARPVSNAAPALSGTPLRRQQPQSSGLGNFGRNRMVEA